MGDSTYRSNLFISLTDANNILEKPAMLRDSTFKNSTGMIRYTLNYIAVFKDTTSKGRIFFTYEQYKTEPEAKSIFESIKTENAKSAAVKDLTDTGDEAFLVKDTLNYPFVMIRKQNKVFKFKVYYLSDDKSLNELLKVAKRVVTAH